MFNEDSTVVQTWVNLVKNGESHMEQVPNLFNLKEKVKSILQNNNQ